MKRSFLVLYAVLASFAFNSCDLNDDDVNFHFVPLQIVSADVPDSFVVNETYTITVTYIIPDGCTYFEGFDFAKPELTTREVVVIGSQRTDQEACTAMAQERESTFDFIVVHDEAYLFKFWQGKDENGEQQYLEIEVPMN